MTEPNGGDQIPVVPRNRREAAWPSFGRVPCVRCRHLYGYHAKHAGRCTIEGCACQAFLHGTNDGGGGMLVVTPEQLRDGYPRSPYVRLGSNVVESERGEYQVITRFADGNYLVRDPVQLAKGEAR